MRGQRGKGGRARAMLAALLLGGSLAVVGGCDREVTVRGNMPDPEIMAVIQPGSYTRQSVAQLLGSPSTLSNFDDDTWYYIGQRQTQFAFLDPDILERSVFVVNFDDAGVVAQTALYTLEDGRIVDPVKRITPTEGRELTILQQIFGNLGRFPASQLEGQ